MINRNYPMWQKFTATHRQVTTHNYVVSRKEEWPEALFALPFQLPEITTLRHLATLQKGATAHMVYFGKVDFGITDGPVPENLLMLRFVREDTGWKFDNTRYFNLEADPGVRRAISVGELSFLADDEFQPTGEVPPVPPKVGAFDFAGEIWILSAGYETTVSVGDLHTSTVANNAVTNVIIGGLAKAGLPVLVETRELEVPDGYERQLRIEIYALNPPRKAAKVWTFKPKPGEVPGRHESKVWANVVTMR